MKTQAQFTFDKVRHDQDQDSHLILSLTAPKIDWQARRPAICITLVPDISGSMGGAKLEYAKRSMLKLVDHLQPGDYCGLVAFESQVHPHMKPVEMTQARKDELKAKIGALHTMGGTNFSGGMLQALEWANQADLPNNTINRIVMFTDGCANEGVARTRESLVHLLGANLGKATLSAFGYGADADQELLADVAKTGKGNYAFIKNPDDALGAFAKELGGLLSTYAQNIVIHVEPQNGHSIQEVVSDVDVTDDSGKITIKIPDLMSEEVRNLVVHMKLVKQAQALPRDMSVADVKLTYDRITDAGLKVSERETLKAKVRFVKPGSEQAKATPDVLNIVALAQLVKVQIEAESRANVGDYVGAMGVMTTFSNSMGAQGCTGAQGMANNISSKMSDHASYTSNSGYLQSSKSGLTRSYGLSSMDSEVSDELIGMGISTTNASQKVLVEEFTKAQGDPGLFVPVVPVDNQPLPVGSIVVTGTYIPDNIIHNPAIGGGITVNPPWSVMFPAVVHPSVQVPTKVEPKPKKLDKKRSKRW